jgi:hypothetical protein
MSNGSHQDNGDYTAVIRNIQRLRSIETWNKVQEMALPMHNLLGDVARIMDGNVTIVK